MRKKVKGGIEKYYCDCCGKLVYDLILSGRENFTLSGMSIAKYKPKKYDDYINCYSGKVFCMDCYNKK